VRRERRAPADTRELDVQNSRRARSPSGVRTSEEEGLLDLCRKSIEEERGGNEKKKTPLKGGSALIRLWVDGALVLSVSRGG